MENGNELSVTLRRMAREHGICNEWHDAWGDDATADDLLKMYVNGIDFAIDKDFVSNEFAKEHFDAKTLASHGVFIDSVVGSSQDNMSTLIMNGECSGVVTYNGYSTGCVYVRHDSHVTIRICDMARCSIEVYDNAFVEVINESLARVFVYVHGGNVSSHGNVLVRDKRGKA